MHRKTLSHTLLWVAFFALYAATTVQGILAADNGEFQLAASGWGVLHPPGYPLYTVVGALWVRLVPLGTQPFRLNLLSAALAASTLVVVAEAIREWAIQMRLPQRAAWAGAVFAATVLGAAPTFWAQATTANIRMPTMLFAAWGFLALARLGHEDQATQDRALYSLALAAGWGVGHHPSLVFVGVGWLLYVLLNLPHIVLQARRWYKPAIVAMLAWGLPQLYLPLRGSMANVPLAPGGLATWHGFWHHVLAQGFAGDMFAFANPQDLALRVPLLPTLFKLQFPALLLVGAAAAWLWLVYKRPRLALPLFTSWAVHTFVTLTYRAPQTVEYLMPAYLPVVLALGLGAAGLAAQVGKATLQEVQARKPALQEQVEKLALLDGVMLFMAAALVLVRLPNFLVLALDTSPEDRVAPLLAAAPSGALILADWRWATPLWVLQQVEGERPDVEVFYVYPVEDQEYEAVWRAHVEAAGARPVLSTHLYSWEGWTFAPVGGGYRLYPRPLSELPSELGFVPLVAELGSIQLLGYRMIGEGKPGAQVELRLAWQASGPQDPAPSFTARLWNASGELLAQDDRFLGSDTAPGEVRFAMLTLQLPIDRCSDTLHPTVGAYTVQDGSFHDLGSVALPAHAMACDLPTLPTKRPFPGVALGAGPFLRGVDYDVQGERATAFLHWCGPGKGLLVQAGDAQAFIYPLAPGRCQTVQLPIPAGGRPALMFNRPDGRVARLLAPPLPSPQPGERYIPFGNAMVLTKSRRAERGGHMVVDLKWRTVRPLVDDYAVSVRLLSEEEAWLGMHDFQPALSDIPTLKWVVRGLNILDPHPFAPLDAPAVSVSLSVYERFRLTPLRSIYGPVTSFPMPK